MTSAAKPVSSRPEAVRQTPFTATLSPSFRSESTAAAPMESTADGPPPVARITPISSTIPVNRADHLAFS
jgi:hypothetical protein